MALSSGVILAEQGFKVATTVRPLELILRDICGADCIVSTLVPAGASEHHWEISPKQIKDFQSVSGGVGIGLGFDERLFKLATPKIFKEGRVLFLEAAFEPLPWKLLGAQDRPTPMPGHDHDHSLGDPHFWFDPVRVQKVIPKLTGYIESLSKDPAVGERIHKRGDELSNKLKLLHSDIDLSRTKWPKRIVVVLHDNLRYWASRYEQDVRSLVSGGSGHEVSIKNFGALVRGLKDQKVSAIVIEQEDGASRNLARSLNTKLVRLDLSAQKDYQSYEAWLRQMALDWQNLLQ